ncbi:MAG: peptidoglycan DD-metalloendopeptidase family protein, partial [Ferruginibacter sp.]
MKFLVIVACLMLHTAYSISQPVKQPTGGGSYDEFLKIKDDISPAKRAAIIQQLQRNEVQLRNRKLLTRSLKPLATLFEWPLVQAPGFNDNGYCGISNYIDNNPSFPNLVLDYNCGNRTYDLASGYNHKGTDIFLWPFPWQKMALNAVQIIAAAPGTIIGKEDGNDDQSCAFCTVACNWNAVYIMHSDGSVAWYGHMKLGSLTTKLIGQTVSAGEYLGVVGSSGNSTGPHLHFEVYTNSSYTQLVDPWAGPCNSFNGATSWWANQEPYYVSTLDKLMTHFAAPAMPGCAGGEAVNGKTNFVNGETVYVGSYYRDQQAGQQSVHSVYRPDNSLYTSWTQNFTNNYNASYWYYTVVLPNAAATGLWKYQVAYMGQTVLSTYFGVNITGYTFNGKNNWSDAGNWSNNTKPPAILPAGSEIIINPLGAGECIVDQPQTISGGAKLTVVSGKKLK